VPQEVALRARVAGHDRPDRQWRFHGDAQAVRQANSANPRRKIRDGRPAARAADV
jgi:hypothetical protein